MTNLLIYRAQTNNKATIIADKSYEDRAALKGRGYKFNADGADWRLNVDDTLEAIAGELEALAAAGIAADCCKSYAKSYAEDTAVAAAKRIKAGEPQAAVIAEYNGIMTRLGNIAGLRRAA